MNLMITGAQFNNKGAQSLLFTVMNEVYKRYVDSTIYYIPLDSCSQYNADMYKFELVYDNLYLSDFKDSAKSYIKKIGRLILDKRTHSKLRDKGKLFFLSEVIKNIDIMINISGYQLSSKFANSESRRFLRYIKLAKQYNIPVILMPQSFGPFEYDKRDIELEIEKQLNRVDLIFAREEDGKSLLAKKYQIVKNVYLSTDLVLQSSEVIDSNIFINEPDNKCIVIKTLGNVGIIPNMQTLIHGNKENILNMYKVMIEKLVVAEKNIYIFRHSDDLPLCKDIYSMFRNSKSVFLIEKDMNCIEYSNFLQQFEFIIASRYHAVVHAYKEGIPAVILGWAVKYEEVAKVLKQERFVVDITKIDQNILSQLLQIIDNMLVDYSKQSKIIRNNIKQIQDKTCFDVCWQLFDELSERKGENNNLLRGI